MKAAAIAATGDIAPVCAARSATSEIPIVFTIGADPVRFGLVASLARPGGNVTGINLFSSILSAKRVEARFELAPKLRRVAMFMNSGNFTAEAEQRDGKAGAEVLGREAVIVNARNPREIEPALAEALRLGADSLITASDPLILDRRGTILAFAKRHGLPVVGFVRQFAVGGAVLSYGPSIVWMYHQAGAYVGAILKGAKPAELPMMQPTSFEFVVNVKAAAELGLAVPPLLLAHADEVVE